MLPCCEYVKDINISQIKNIKNIGNVTIYELEELLYEYRQEIDLVLLDKKLEITLNSKLKKNYKSNRASIQMGVISENTLKESFKLGVLAYMNLLGNQLGNNFSNRPTMTMLSHI